MLKKPVLMISLIGFILNNGTQPCAGFSKENEDKTHQAASSVSTSANTNLEDADQSDNSSTYIVATIVTAAVVGIGCLYYYIFGNKDEAEKTTKLSLHPSSQPDIHTNTHTAVPSNIITATSTTLSSNSPVIGDTALTLHTTASATDIEEVAPQKHNLLPILQILSSSSDIKLLGQETENGLFLNVLLKDNRFLYFALRTPQAVESDEQSADHALFTQPTLGTRISINDALGTLRSALGTMQEELVPLDQLLSCVAELMSHSGSSVRQLVDHSDQSTYFFTLDTNQHTISLGLINSNNTNFGLEPLPSTLRLTSDSLSRLQRLSLDTSHAK